MARDRWNFWSNCPKLKGMSWTPHPVEVWYSRHSAALDLSASSLPPLSVSDLGVDFSRVSLGYLPRTGGAALKEALVRHYPGAGPDQILVTTGAAEALWLLQTTLLNPGDDLAVRRPCYPSLYRVAVERGCRLVEPGEAAALTLLNSPHNPTGRLTSADEMALVAGVSGAWAVDEVFRGLSHEVEPPTAFSRGGLSIGSASKTLAMPGARIGWIVGPADLIAALAERRDDTSLCPNALGEMVVARALDQFDAIAERHRAQVLDRWHRVERAFAELGVPVARPAGGVTLWLKLPTSDCVGFCERLLEATGVMLLPGALLGEAGFARLGFGIRRETLEEGLRRLQGFWRWYTANLSKGDRHANLASG